ncbi:60S ribosomal protein L33B [Dispira parvispora]|uniref:60S ribosomal protein L33B n=1 Tax=Dispira parvispora TaxID=1520584 RepID=A0A9W8ATS0_9FUNG|nr:60S ribosomal protein L33B [Dispira parvispora]
MGKPVRLYTRARVLGYKRSRHIQSPDTSLLKLENVATKEETGFYLGKRVAYIYRAKRVIKGSNVRVVWGRITRSHGNSGVVRAKFAKNLPPKSFGSIIRVMLYPSSI